MTVGRGKTWKKMRKNREERTEAKNTEERLRSEEK